MNKKLLDNELYTMDSVDKVRKTIRLLKSANLRFNWTVAFSGGKDSMVLKVLCQEAGIKNMVYTNTTIDPPYTLPFVRKQGAAILQPEKTFFQIVRQKGFPTMFKRYCCDVLKKRYIGDYLITGVRADESVKRSLRFNSIETCPYSKAGGTKDELLPLVWFNNHDLMYMIDRYQIELHPLYYKPDGSVDLNRRLGCLCCPLPYDRGVADMLRYPRFAIRLIRTGCQHYEGKGLGREYAYKVFIKNTWYSKNNEHKFAQAFEGLFPLDPKEFIAKNLHLNPREF